MTVPAVPTKIAMAPSCQMPFVAPSDDGPILIAGGATHVPLPPAIWPLFGVRRPVPEVESRARGLRVDQVDLIGHRCLQRVGRARGHESEIEAVVRERAGVIDQAIDACAVGSTRRDGSRSACHPA